VLFTFLVFCVEIFGWLNVAHIFSFLCCDLVSNTQPTKNHNTENIKGEQHPTNQKSQHRKLKR
jgi:hypothetical protein